MTFQSTNINASPAFITPNNTITNTPMIPIAALSTFPQIIRPMVTRKIIKAISCIGSTDLVSYS